jgi:pyruvate/2-oxoglutarate/acetoin dehydrogenase E1 component
VLAVARHCSRVLIVHEDSRTGGIGESLARSSRRKRSNRWTRRCGSSARSTRRCPYSPPLEEFFLPSKQRIERRPACWSRIECDLQVRYTAAFESAPRGFQ